MDCLSPILIRNKDPIGLDYEYRKVPCGKCEACVNRKKSEWFIRLKQEQIVTDNVCFVTLTYDDEHLPKDFSVSVNDCQLFLKRLRSYLYKPIKYYLTSEYGPQTFRPHYHAIFFGLSSYDCEQIEKAWQNGFVTVAEISDERIRYVCGYVVEKLFTPPGRKPIFNLISKGLGKSYVEKYQDWHHDGGILNRSYCPYHGSKFPMPRYYKEKIYSKPERAVYEQQCSDKADEKFQKLLDRYGEETYKHIVESNRAYIEKARKVHKQKKQL